ncbi:MAG: hypothetical protein SPL39_02915 [Selenomonadaceae bacterium]|nr:hypothetical protein [Selenomonadaceae bacterium]
MYYMYLGEMQIPIPPPSLTTKIGSRNKTYELLETGEVNIIRSSKLTEISFRFMLPNTDYPFSQKKSGGLGGSLLTALTGGSNGLAPSLISSLKELKTSGEPTRFILVRMKQNGGFINMMNMQVTLEEYSIEDSADEGYDLYANVTLKRYVEFGTKKLQVQTDASGAKTAKASSLRSTVGHKISAAKGVLGKVKSGQTLAQFAKKALGSAAYWPQLAKFNKIAIPAVLKTGMNIKIPPGIAGSVGGGFGGGIGKKGVGDILSIPGAVLH